ncbi:hypothetical protein O6H91_18G009300 [Diphasiastrum complanatum]|uniref:Uncharacterized protein n=2 Tax=Diphasiastrum complanatum TaxID=34168 RepID=A0ACC2AY04_DIPCM|nr:hypothetical protein O6H91_Y023700 [Diphasiastrum complanatum]KAJ7522407.1 hypothetical protein O6H91_18G009300 [Diphasiastrum complanatum]KAJ7522408.1 hypothetical protein O6H91_18G009300 [Diphasiastrum complanatum]
MEDYPFDSSFHSMPIDVLGLDMAFDCEQYKEPAYNKKRERAPIEGEYHNKSMVTSKGTTGNKDKRPKKLLELTQQHSSQPQATWKPDLPVKSETSQEQQPKEQESGSGNAYDVKRTPAPYCSCTGENQQCYRWGTGGWQSACCTTLISVHPLPMNPKKRGSRVAGRKMSAGAFHKLLERMVLEGWDASCPIDLKDHWAKHGTNRYVTRK